MATDTTETLAAALAMASGALRMISLSNDSVRQAACARDALDRLACSFPADQASARALAEWAERENAMSDDALPAIPDLAGQPESDGWIEWRGGECPVDPQAIVLIEMRRCGRSAGRAFTLEWSHRGKDGDIIAYRVAEQKETQP